MYRIAPTLAVLMLSGVPTARTPHLDAPVSIPFTTTDEGLVVVPATLNDSVSAHLIFDTGAGVDVLAASLVERLHGTPSGRFSAYRMWGDRVDIQLYTIKTLRVGSNQRRNVVVGSWDVLDKLHLDGIVSMADFRQQPVTFDFVNKVVVLETPRSLAQRARAGTVAPIRFDDDRGIALDMFARFDLGADSGLCELDTGSPTATFNVRYLAPLGVDTADSAVRRLDSRNAGGASGVRYATTVPQWSLAVSPLVTAKHAHVTFADIIYDCVAGIDFWSGKAVTFDVPGRRLIVAS